MLLTYPLLSPFLSCMGSRHIIVFAGNWFLGFLQRNGYQQKYIKLKIQIYIIYIYICILLFSCTLILNSSFQYCGSGILFFPQLGTLAKHFPLQSKQSSFFKGKSKQPKPAAGRAVYRRLHYGVSCFFS